MEVSKTRELPKPEDAGDEEREYEDYTEVETINSMIPIWRCSKSEVTDEASRVLGKVLQDRCHDFTDHVGRCTFSIHAEARSIDALLFIPGVRAVRSNLLNGQGLQEGAWRCTSSQL